MTGALANPLPALEAADGAALRASIERFTVLVPILVDQHGQIVDGAHRKAIADELGIPCPVHRVELPDDPEERGRALAEINDARRQRMSPEQRGEIVAHLRATGHSLRAAAAAVGVSKSQAARDAAKAPGDPTAHQVSRAGHLPESADQNGDRAASAPPLLPTVTGRDGKRYPATRKRQRSKIQRLPASPAWARVVLTANLRKLRKELGKARAWRDSGRTPPPELFERLADTRQEAAGFLRDLEAFVGNDAQWGERPKDGEHIAAAYLRRAVEILALADDVPRPQLESCQDHLDALYVQLSRLRNEDDAA